MSPIKEHFDENWTSHDYTTVRDRKRFNGKTANGAWNSFNPSWNLRPAWGNDDFDFHKPKWSRDRFNRWHSDSHNDNNHVSLYNKPGSTMAKNVILYVLIAFIVFAIIYVITQRTGNNRR